MDCLYGEDHKSDDWNSALEEAIQHFSAITFLSGQNPWRGRPFTECIRFFEVEFRRPCCSARRRLWEQMLDGRHAVAADVSIRVLANRFRFTGGQIRDVIARAENVAALRSNNGDAQITMDDLLQSSREQSNQKLSEMARKVAPCYGWADIILPPEKMEHLQEIAGYVKHRYRVYEDWGFDRKLSQGKGLNILFAGPSGTGKTMAAGIIANELGLDMHKIDLSCVVSKYIGETEKNLARIFKEAETTDAILFFDEADALFGKRSEVKDSHDRYANIEINYLLQKMEEHEGIVVLASNLQRNIDDAFARRMHFSVYFPFPEKEYRLSIWQNVFPAETPVSDDIDFEFLAASFRLSGGNIKNIALSAAFLAADTSDCVTVKHIILATKREYEKIGRQCSESEFGKYYDLVRPGKGTKE